MFDRKQCFTLFYLYRCIYRGQAKRAWRLVVNVEIAMCFRSLTTVIREDSGATSIEYGVIDALVSGAAIVALTAMGGSMNMMVSAVSQAVTTVADG